MTLIAHKNITRLLFAVGVLAAIGFCIYAKRFTPAVTVFVVPAGISQLALNIRGYELTDRLVQHNWQLCTNCLRPLKQGERWLECPGCGKQFEKWEAPAEWKTQISRTVSYKGMKL
ncbi:MAG: hypothetical protein U0640_11310 [Phycisphaerales bacterium]